MRVEFPGTGDNFSLTPSAALVRGRPWQKKANSGSSSAVLVGAWPIQRVLAFLAGNGPLWLCDEMTAMMVTSFRLCVCVCARAHSQSCPALRNSTDCSPPDFSVYGILLSRMLEWVAILRSRHCSKGLPYINLLTSHHNSKGRYHFPTLEDRKTKDSVTGQHHKSSKWWSQDLYPDILL